MEGPDLFPFLLIFREESTYVLSMGELDRLDTRDKSLDT